MRRERMYSISKLKGKWKVNKQSYIAWIDNFTSKYIELIPEKESSNPHRNNYKVKKLAEDVFLTIEDAEEECKRRNSSLKCLQCGSSNLLYYKESVNTEYRFISQDGTIGKIERKDNMGGGTENVMCGDCNCIFDFNVGVNGKIRELIDY